MKRNTWLSLPPVLLALLDLAVTLLAQPADYWQGHYGFAQEPHPLFVRLLEWHPIAFAAGDLLWIALFVIVIGLLPRRGAMILSMLLVMTNAWGVSTWLCWRVPGGYWLTLLLFAASAWLLSAAWEKSRT
jgi:hypothetical protein